MKIINYYNILSQTIVKDIISGIIIKRFIKEFRKIFNYYKLKYYSTLPIKYRIRQQHS